MLRNECANIIIIISALNPPMAVNAPPIATQCFQLSNMFNPQS